MNAYSKFKDMAERSVSSTNCNPLLYLVALAVIVGGLMYHFRSAIIHTVVLTLMWLSAIFILFSVAHITRHIISWHKKHSHVSAENAKEEFSTVVDPVAQAESVLSAALEGLGTEATQSVPKHVE
jgi:multisubunit Na+/H+ antiporter MnhC subunit